MAMYIACKEVLIREKLMKIFTMIVSTWDGRKLRG